MFYTHFILPIRRYIIKIYYTISTDENYENCYIHCIRVCSAYFIVDNLCTYMRHI